MARSTIRSVASGVSSDGFITTLLPAAMRRRHLPCHEQQRVVERRDASDNSERFLDGEVDLVFGDRRDG